MRIVVLYFILIACFAWLGINYLALQTQAEAQQDLLTRQVEYIGELEAEIASDDDIFMTIFGDDWSRDLTLYRQSVKVTAYSSAVDQCDASPHITADGSVVRVGIVAVSRDLLTELGMEMGQRIMLAGYGVFEIRDTMHKRKRRQVDIWMPDRKAALLHGVKTTTLLWFGREAV